MNVLFTPRTYRRTLFLLFIAALFPRLILAYLNHTPLRTPMDEICTLSTAAYAAGLDWGSIITKSNHYYGGGFTILLAPLFKWITNPFALYASVLSVGAILQSLIAPIAFHIQYRYLGVHHKVYLFISALAVSFMTAVRCTLFYNEQPLILMFWIITWILCILLQNQDHYRSKAIYSSLLMLVISYGLTLHARTKIYYIALIILILAYYFLYRKWLVARIPALISTVIGYFAASKFIDWIKAAVFLYQEGEFMKNTEVSLHLSLDLLLSPTAWEGWLATIIGQVHTSTIFTVGFAGIAIPLIVIFLYRSITGAPVFAEKKWSTGRSLLLSEDRPYLFILAAFCTLCIGGTIFAQSLSWLFRVESALKKSAYGTNAYGYKAFTYFRYYAVYIGPFFLTALSLLYHKKELVKKYWGYILTFFVSIQTLFVCFVLPHISRNTVASEIYWAFSFWKSLSSTRRMEISVYLAGILVTVILFTISFICYLKKKIMLPLILLAGMLLYHYCYSSLYVDGTYMEHYISKTNTTYHLIHTMEENDETLPHTLYSLDTKGKTQKRIYTQQFLFRDHQIIPQLPDADLDNAIVFCDVASYPELLNLGYSEAQLDSNEFLYVKGASYLALFEEYGVVFHE